MAIVYRIHTREALRASESLCRWLSSKGVKVFTAPEQKKLSGAPLAKKGSMKEMDLVLVLGGDGTYLRAIRLLEHSQVPILGFNMGSLGFLTSHPPSQIRDLVSQALKGEMQLQSRSLLQTEVFRGKKLRGRFLSLNDVVVERGFNSHLISTSILTDRNFVSEVKADGLIVASPTGSTAYNLAAGGPILDPEVRAIVVTPVAPHALTSRPLIFPDHHKLTFQLRGPGLRGNLIVDGRKELEIAGEDIIQISRSNHEHWLLRCSSRGFYHLLREKLKFGDRN